MISEYWHGVPFIKPLFRIVGLTTNLGTFGLAKTRKTMIWVGTYNCIGRDVYKPWIEGY